MNTDIPVGFTTVTNEELLDVDGGLFFLIPIASFAALSVGGKVAAGVGAVVGGVVVGYLINR